MEKFTGEYQSADGSSAVAYTVWRGEERRAIVHIVHGMCEYADRYDDIAAYLTEQGFVVCGQDHLGHGRTAASGDALGFFADKDGWKLLVEDTRRLQELIKAEYPGIPYIVYGHSMGSFIARCFFAKYDGVDAAVFSGTAGKNPASGLLKAICGVTKAFCGKRARSKLSDRITGGIYLERIKDPNTKYDWISHDTAIVEKYAADPFCTYIFTASAYIDLMDLLEKCNSAEWYAQVPKDKPILLLSGAEDPVGGYGEGVREVYNGLLDAGAADVSIMLYEGMRHEPHNETGRADVYSYVSEWMTAAVDE